MASNVANKPELEAETSPTELPELYAKKHSDHNDYRNKVLQAAKSLHRERIKNKAFMDMETSPTIH